MKTTVELPDSLFRSAKATAAAQGQTLREFLTAAIEEKLERVYRNRTGEPAWMQFAGSMRDFPEEMDKIDAAIEAAFEQIEEDVR